MSRSLIQAFTVCSVESVIGGELADNHGASTAIAFGAAFFGADAASVFAQPLQHRTGGCRVFDFNDLAIMEKRIGREGARRVRNVNTSG